MPYKFNPFTGTLDYYQAGSGSGFDVDKILTDGDDVLIDSDGNVLLET